MSENVNKIADQFDPIKLCDKCGSGMCFCKSTTLIDSNPLKDKPMSHNQNLFNKVAEITGCSLLQDEMAEIIEAIRKDEQPTAMREKTEPINYALIPMSDITSEARRISVKWMEGFEDWMKTDIRHKHKLASDIMNYAISYHDNKMKKLQPSPALQDAVKENFGAIHLFAKEGHAVVSIEVNDKWIELMKEPLDSPFSRIIEPLGIQRKIESA